ncbi:MAG: TIGR00282 family metallophosphoesterase [Eubacteriales bacterium]
MREIRLLALGDAVRHASCEYLRKNLPRFKAEHRIDITVINGENCSENGAIDRESAEELLLCGADIITTGNHAFRAFDSKKLFEENRFVIRPANFPDVLPGNGYVLFPAAGLTFLIINVMGVVLMEPLGDPFAAVEKILRENEGKYDISVLDIHAEATSEKKALAYYFDGRINAVFGTHTHVETADEQILPQGTAYITDLGMCGADISVLGIKPECIIEKLRMHTPVRFTAPENAKITAHGAIFTFSSETGKAISVERIKF